MRTRHLLVSLGLVFCGSLWMLGVHARVGVAAGAPTTGPATGPAAQTADYAITGPYVHDNLAVFILHGPDHFQGGKYLTLQEALEQKVVVVHETGNVNELSIENVSSDKDVYVQSGDIVKGGRQDRTIAQDFIAPPRSGKMPINAFCVEHGRWTNRGHENAAAFDSSGYAVAGKGLKLAARQSMSQSQVWAQVSENQGKLAQNAGQSVNDPRSETSYQLTLENKKVKETTDAYVNELQKIIDGKADAVGYAFAVNGKVNSAEAYGSHDLFVKLWPKLLRSSAVEAYAELKKGTAVPAVSTRDVMAVLDDAAKGKTESKNLTQRVRGVTKETLNNVCYETQDRATATTQPAGPSAYVHRTYLTKDELSEPGTVAARNRAQDQIQGNSNVNARQQQPARQQQEQVQQPPASPQK